MARRNVMRCITLFLGSILILSCSSPSQSTDQSYCGDGICVEPETVQNCRRDCESQISSIDENTSPGVSLPPAADETILYLGIMVHLEHWDDEGSKAEFEEHVAYIREYAHLFEVYGAKLTLESKEVTDGILQWGDNVLFEMEQRGHGIGVHADIGGYQRYDCSQFADELRTEKQQLESLGVTVKHVSGIVSHCDWVTAAVEAGYSFTTGQVAYSVMSMPEDQRPPEFRNCEDPRECHDVFPPNLSDRMHPWRMNSGADWLTHDTNGKLVMLAASQGIACMEEELTDTADRGCTFNRTDVNRFFEQLEQAIARSEPGQINIFYVWWSLGEQFLDEEILETWLQRIQPYVESGQVAWKTLPEIYDAYVGWEQQQ